MLFKIMQFKFYNFMRVFRIYLASFLKVSTLVTVRIKKVSFVRNA